MNLKEIFIRLKSRPTHDDLKYIANKSIDFVLKNKKGSQLKEILERHYPDGHWKSTLVNRVTTFMNDVSKGETRKDQGTIFRKGLTTAIDNSSVNNFVFENDTREAVWLIYHYADTPDLNENQRKQLFLTEWALDNLTTSILKTIYLLQYNSTLDLHCFDDLYKAICITCGEIVINTSIANHADAAFIYPLAAAYIEFVTDPIQDEALNIKKKCKHAIIGGDLKSINELRIEAIDFAKTYQQAVDKIMPYSEQNHTKHGEFD